MESTPSGAERPIEISQAPPGSWAPAHRAVRRLVRPVEELLATETTSGALLGVAALAALVAANSPLAGAYHALWVTPLTFGVGEASVTTTLRFVVDEVLMTLFFFVVGLEIRRELVRGELSEIRRASLPFAAALGGMVVPAGVFSSLNVGRSSASGWGVPMATDIAFADAALALLGRRVPPALRVFLLSLAVIDDVGAIVVIGLFYSTGFSAIGLVLAAAGMIVIVMLQRFGARSAVLYSLPGAVVWAGLHEAGVHATLAGVAVGLATPAVAWVSRDTLAASLARLLDRVRSDASIPVSLSELDAVGREAIAPVDALQHALHPWVAFGVMPLFAFANAGVSLDAVNLSGDRAMLAVGVVAGLVVGKPVGIVLGSFVATRLGAKLPTGLTWSSLWVVGAAGGIGFTMSLFVADLAFEGPAHEAAKAAVLVASLLAALAAVALGRIALRDVADGRASTESEAEQSTST